jgi:hypothetical protein
MSWLCLRERAAASGPAHRRDRVGALGSGWVPIVAARAWRRFFGRFRDLNLSLRMLALRRTTSLNDGRSPSPLEHLTGRKP